MKGLLNIFFAVLITLPTVHLLADGWGRTGEVLEHEGAQWDGVYFDTKAFKLTAAMPNYAGTSLQNGMVILKGTIEKNGYLILTSYNPDLNLPKNLKEFIKLIQEANPNYLLNVIDAEKFGAKYVIDLTPQNQEDPVCWRLIVAKNRLIKMATEDLNANRRDFFFESLRVQ